MLKIVFHKIGPQGVKKIYSPPPQKKKNCEEQKIIMKKTLTIKTSGTFLHLRITAANCF